MGVSFCGRSALRASVESGGIVAVMEKKWAAPERACTDPCHTTLACD